MTRIFFATLVALVFGISDAAVCSEEQNKPKTAPPSGKAIYQKNCSVCHSLKPPPKMAPPIVGMAAHYRDAFTDKDAAITHMVQFMQAPDSSKSKLEPQAIARFGLMPVIPLSEKELRTVSEWLWNQYDPSFALPKRCN
ncbi:MAG: cytochrome c [Chlorobiales bacterium]|nr:cytochrome c [Chlorobiales bacterium]